MTRRKRHSEAVRREILEEQGGTCWYCHQPLAYGDAEFDHQLALGLGGADNPLNLVACCIPCHRGPGAKTADDRKRMAKSDRQRRYHETGKARALKGRKIQSRGFDKTYRRKMDGTTERRDG